MFASLINFVKKFWKYILIFLLGFSCSLLIPSSNVSRLVKKGSKYAQNKEKQIQQLTETNRKLEEDNKKLTQDKKNIESSYFVLSHERDSINVLILNKNKEIIKINKQYEEVNNIDNYNVKQLYQFFSDYNK